MNGFYEARSRGATVSDALRSAQLRQLRALRAGRVTMKAGNQTVALPATPLLWAGYIAVGAP
jgi:CHAT domain-containing protein